MSKSSFALTFTALAVLASGCAIDDAEFDEGGGGKADGLSEFEAHDIIIRKLDDKRFCSDELFEEGGDGRSVLCDDASKLRSDELSGLMNIEYVRDTEFIAFETDVFRVTTDAYEKFELGNIDNETLDLTLGFKLDITYVDFDADDAFDEVGDSTFLASHHETSHFVTSIKVDPARGLVRGTWYANCSDSLVSLDCEESDFELALPRARRGFVRYEITPLPVWDFGDFNEEATQFSIDAKIQ